MSVELMSRVVHATQDALRRLGCPDLKRVSWHSLAACVRHCCYLQTKSVTKNAAPKPHT